MTGLRSAVQCMDNTGFGAARVVLRMAFSLALLPAAAFAQGSDLQTMRSMVAGCLEAFPGLRPTYEAKSALLVDRHRDVLPDGWSFATAPQALFTVAMMRQEGGQALCENAVDTLDRMSLRRIVGMREKAEATGREEQLTRRLLAGDAPRVTLGVRFSLDAPARVQAIFPSSPAQAAGIQVDDVIVSVAGRLTPAGADVMLEMLDVAPDGLLAIQLRRGGQLMLISVRPSPMQR